MGVTRRTAITRDRFHVLRTFAQGPGRRRFPRWPRVRAEGALLAAADEGTVAYASPA